MPFARGVCGGRVFADEITCGRWCLLLTLRLGCDVVRRGSGRVSGYSAAFLA
jgi:hypothetical protein